MNLDNQHCGVSIMHDWQPHGEAEWGRPKSQLQSSEKSVAVAVVAGCGEICGSRTAESLMNKERERLLFHLPSNLV